MTIDKDAEAIAYRLERETLFAEIRNLERQRDEMIELLAKCNVGNWASGGIHTNGGMDPWPNDSAEILAESRELAYDLRSHATWHRGGELVERLVARIKQLEYGQIGKVPL